MPRNTLALVGKAGLPESAIEELTGLVAREHAASAIRSVRSGSEANDQYLGRGVAKPGNRPTPVGFSTVRSPLDAPDLLPVMDQARTPMAFDNLVTKDTKVFRSI